MRFNLIPVPLVLLLALLSSAAQFRMEGADNLSRKKIESVLTLPENPRELSVEDWEDWVDESAAAITDLYADIGYLDAAVKFDRPEPDSGKSGDPGILVQIREGSRYAFGKVSVVAPDGAPSFIRVEKLRSRSGREFEKDLVYRDRGKILNAYGDAGFLHARSVEELTPDTSAKTVNLEFQVDPGPAVLFDTLVVRNLREGDSTGKPGVTSVGLLKSLLNVAPGDTVSLSGFAGFERKLKSTRVFNYVRLRDSLLENRDGRSALILSTEERVPGEADASLFYETQYGGGLAANWTHANLRGKLYEGRLGGSWAQRKQSLFLGYASPLFFGSSFRFDNDLISNWYQDSRLQLDAPSYRGDFDITNSSKLSRAFTHWMRGVSTTELTGQSEKIDSVDRERSFNLNFINAAFLAFLDDAANPARGSRLSFTWGNGGTFLDEGKIDVPVLQRHNWLEGESALYYPLTERFKLAFRLDGGRFYGEGDVNAERFFLGGPRSVRSYGWRKICPERDPVSGGCVSKGMEPAYFLTSFEIRTHPFSSGFVNPDGRWKFLLGLQVVPFVDYGKVWELGAKLTPEGQGKAFGLGLRYSLLSIFNLRLDYAVNGPDRNREQWILDLAQAF